MKTPSRTCLKLVCVISSFSFSLVSPAFAETEVTAVAGMFTGNDFTLTSDNAAGDIEDYVLTTEPDFQGIRVRAARKGKLKAGAGCKDLGGGEISCLLPVDADALFRIVGHNLSGDKIVLDGRFPGATIGLEGKGGDDVLDASSLGAPDATVTMRGDNGNDFITSGTTQTTQLFGGQGNDILAGGAGDDRFEAESIIDGQDTIQDVTQGFDCVSYQNRTAQVWVVANSQPDSGDLSAMPRENDLVPKEVPCLIGGQNTDMLELSASPGTTNKPPTVDGGDGSDVIAGSELGDKLTGGKGDDIMNGREGNDLLEGDAGKDVLHGQAGTDTLQGGTEDDMLFGHEGNDVLSGDDGDDRLSGSAGNDKLEGKDGDDKLEGDIGEDALLPGDGKDAVSGGADDDFIQVEFSKMTGDGSDTFAGDDGTDKVSFSGYTSGADLQLTMNTLADDGLSGEQDNLESDIENVVSGDGDDTIEGSLADNQIDAGDGNDTVDGGAGDDILYGQAGDDLLQGSSDNDIFIGGAGSDIFDGGTGRKDTVNYQGSSSGVEVTIDNVGNDGTTGEQDDVRSDIETVIGSQFDDKLTNEQPTIVRLTGEAGNDILQGGLFIDTLEGGEGNDTLNGNESDDTLSGGAGNDKLLGGIQEDQLDGGPGEDQLKGEDGFDTLISGNDGDDDLSGGAGTDRVTYEFSPAKIIASLDEQSNDGSLNSNEKDNIHNDVERVDGSDFNDIITGNTDKNELRGNAGDDQLDGKDGVDILDGGTGGDHISARDQSADTVGCGFDMDVATVDDLDLVHADCERVERPQRIIDPLPPAVNPVVPPGDPVVQPPTVPIQPQKQKVCVVPNLRNKTTKRARQLIHKAGLRVGKSRRKTVKSKRRIGRVIAQSVKARTKVRCGSIVRVTVGKKSKLARSHSR